MNLHRARGPLAALVLLLAFAGTTAANPYTEDFLSDVFMDPDSTSAWWDTDAGQLKFYPRGLNAVARLAPADSIWDAAAQGNLLFLAAGDAGLISLDISDPEDPFVISSVSTGGNARELVVDGQWAYVANRDDFVAVIDLSDPAAMFFWGECAAQDPRALCLEGDRLYVVDFNAGLLVYDVTDPGLPSMIGLYDNDQAGAGLAVSGDLALYADEFAGLVILDVSEPTDPLHVATLAMPAAPRDVRADGRLAYLACDTAGLQVVDIGDPALPVIVGSLASPAPATCMRVNGDGGLLGMAGYGMMSLDIGDPATPLSLGTGSIPGGVGGLFMADRHAYLACGGGGLRVNRIAEWSSPQEALHSATNLTDARSVTTAGNLLFCGEDGGELHVVDITNPASPVELTVQATPFHLRDLQVSGSTLYAAALDSGLVSFDIGDPANPAVLDWTAYGNCQELEIRGNHAYIACGVHDLQVVDISDPGDLQVIASQAGGFTSRVIEVVGDLAYVGTQAGGIDIFDIGDPAAPSLVSSTGFLGLRAYGIVVDGQQCYLACSDPNAGPPVFSIGSIDVSDPAAPFLLDSQSGLDEYHGLGLIGEHLIVPRSQGISCYDISDPGDLQGCTGIGGMSGVGMDVAFSGEYIFNAGGARLVTYRTLDFFTVPLECRGQSLPINGATGTIASARMTSQQIGDVGWELSADGGASWTAMLPDGQWTPLDVPGEDLRWRATMTRAGLGDDTWCSDLAIEWLEQNPIITSILDIPGDQGGQVRLRWTRSMFDVAGSGTPITQYGVYRRIDDREYPPGDWDFIATLPATADDQYAMVVPTLGDSTIADGMFWSIYFVRALTDEPAVYYNSLPDSGWSVDNLAPSVPRGFAVGYSSGGNLLSWEECEDEDFRYFRVYRGESEDFEPAPENLVHQTTGTSWSDAGGGLGHHYKITALDFAGNESDPASPESVTGLDDPEAPAALRLLGNVPNPFNPATEIRFEVPAGGAKVKLEIFDATGRRVRLLLDGFREAGRHEVVWKGRDDRGAELGSGLYLCRFSAPGHESARKMLLLK